MIIAHGIPITGPGPAIEAWAGLALAATLLLAAGWLFARLATGGRR